MKNFTRTEWEIIIHRLEVGDAIVECLTDGDDTLIDWQTYDAIYMLLLNGCSRQNFTDLEMIVLRDCCTGCTFFADIHDAVARDEMTRGQMLAYFRAAKSLENKLDVRVTTC